MSKPEQTGTQLDEIGGEALSDSGFEGQETDGGAGEQDNEESEDLSR